MKLKYKTLLPVFLIIILAVSFPAQAQQTLFIDKLEYSCATAFNIAVRTKNISNVVALQGSVSWDTAVVKYNGISFGTSAINLGATNINVSAAANGYLTFLWFDNNLQGQSAPDSSSLFTINFITNGTGKGKGMVSFANAPTQLEIDTLAAGGVPVNNTAAVFTNGYIVTPFIYHFFRGGNWNTAFNWKNEMVPPSVLPTCSEIIIDPDGNAECVLNVQQTIAPGGKVTVLAGKKFVVEGNLTLQ